MLWRGCRMGEFSLGFCIYSSDKRMQTYRGACTVKDWSNTTACPTQYCNKCEPCLSSCFVYYKQPSSSGNEPRLMFCTVRTNIWANIFMCPGGGPSNNQTWWCGDGTVCEGSSSASFIQYTSGSILGFPTIATISTQLATTTQPQSAATSVARTNSPSASNSIPASILSASSQESLANPVSAAGTHTASSESSQTPHPAASMATGIGAGVGVPLGIAVVGLIGFLFWKEARRKDKVKPRHPALRNDVSSRDWTSAELHDERWITEMSDHQVPWELDHRAGKVELPGVHSRTR